MSRRLDASNRRWLARLRSEARAFNEVIIEAVTASARGIHRRAPAMRREATAA
jgi:hypothetical protein